MSSLLVSKLPLDFFWLKEEEFLLEVRWCLKTINPAGDEKFTHKNSSFKKEKTPEFFENLVCREEL